MGHEAPRKVVFIDPRFQLAFVLKFLVLLLVGTGLFLLAAYLILDRRLDETYYSAHVTIKSTSELLLPTLAALGAAFIVVLGLATAIITLYVSHHIAGPLFAVRRYLESVSKGELDFEPRLRGHDQTTPLAQSLARALETLNARLVAIRAGADGVRAASQLLHRHLDDAQAGSESCRSDLAALLARTEALQREIDFFHLRRGPDRG